MSGVRVRVSAVVLAAGASSRMGTRNKLLCEFDGESLISRAVRAVAGSRCTEVIVVTGAEASRVEAELADCRVRLVRNPDHLCGMSGSLRRGILAVRADSDAALVHLADMPGIGAAHVDRLIEAFDPAQPSVVVPVRNGRRGHPVLWPRGHFASLLDLRGDTGAREVLRDLAAGVRAVEFDTDAIFEDIDTPEQLARAGGLPPS